MKHIKTMSEKEELQGTGVNFLRPQSLETEDTPEDWLCTSLIFSKALGLLLKDKEGIVIELVGEMKTLLPNTKKL